MKSNSSLADISHAENLFNSDPMYFYPQKPESLPSRCSTTIYFQISNNYTLYLQKNPDTYD